MSSKNIPRITQLSCERIINITGNLSEDNFKFNSKFTESIDSIIYNISQHEYSTSYSFLNSRKKALNLIKFASTYQLKKIYLISTTDIFNISNKGNHLEEFNVSIKYVNSNLDFSISTWVSERLFVQASKQGIPVTIFRNGILSIDDNCKFETKDNLICTLLENSLKLKIWPKMENELFPSFLPINFATDSIIDIIKKGNINGKALHIKNPNEKITFNEIQKNLTHFVDDLKLLSFDDWMDKISNFDQVLNINQKFRNYQQFDSRINFEIFEQNLLTHPQKYSDLISNYFSHLETLEMYD